MNAGTACSVVLLVLGTNAAWLFVLWLVIGHVFKNNRSLIQQNSELARRTWATEVAMTGTSGSVAQSLYASGERNTDPFAGVPTVPVHGDDENILNG